MKHLSQAVSGLVGLVTWYVAPIISAIDPEVVKLTAVGAAASVFAFFVLIGLKR